MTSNYGKNTLPKTSIACLVTIGLCWSSALGESPDWDNAIGQPGVSGWVWSLKAFDDGQGEALYAGGTFGFAGDLRVNRIARWDGEQWGALGEGLNGFVRPLEVFDDGTGEALYAGGHFTHTGNKEVNYIARWDGQEWSNVGGGMNDFVQGSALVVFDDGTGPALYAGGSFTMAGGVEANGIARWDGENWTEVGGGVHGEEAKVSSLAVFDDGTGTALYVGGQFETAGNIPAQNIAKWDGEEWHSLGGGISGGNDGPKSMAVFNDGTGDALYIGGHFTHADNQRVDYVAKWNGAQWSSVGSGLDWAVRSLATFDDGNGEALYAGGFFGTVDQIEFNGIAKWDGEKWSPLGTGVGGDAHRVYGMEVWNDGGGQALYVGGTFTSAGGLPANRISLWGRNKKPIGQASYQEWLADVLDDERLTKPEYTDPDGDPGGIGIPNLLRYAFVLDVEHPDHDGLPRLQMQDESGDVYLSISYTERTGAEDLHYRVEFSDDLTMWTPLTNNTIDVASGHGENQVVVARDNIPITDSARRFLRVVVELNGD